MGEALQAVADVSTMLDEIGVAATQQQAGIAQINEAMTMMDSITQQNAAPVELSSAATESLKERATRLSGLVSVFQLDASDASASR
jgi:methyl-accepting chemotaxis protein I, serine sensor receptor